MNMRKAVGPISANILIVSEYPDSDSIQNGLPIAGSTKWELNRMLQAAGVSLDSCRVTNVCHYRPPWDKIEEWVAPKLKGALPTTTFQGMQVMPQVMEGVRFLEEEIKRLNPTVIIAFGNLALWALTGKWGINNWRGSILPCTLVPDCKVIPTFHPTFIFKSYADRIDLIADLRRAVAESRFRGIRAPNWTFHTGPSLKLVLEYLNDLPSEVICDIETVNRQIRCVGIGRSLTEAMCIPIFSNQNKEGYWSAADEALVVSTMGKALASRNVVNQNMLYDSFYLSWLWGQRITPVFDTMIAQGVLFPGRPKSLDYLASLHCEFYQYWKHDNKDWHGYINDQDLWHYNCQDCVYTWEVAASLRTAIHASGLDEQLAFEMSQFEPIHQMMLRGVNSSPKHRDRMSFDLEVAVQKRWRELEQIFGHKINPNSPKQMCSLFYTDLKMPAIINRKSKAPTCDDAALEKIGGKEPLLLPVTKRISESRSLRLVKKNFVDVQTPDGRMYTSYNPVGTVTFRYNSSKNPMGYGTNLQNILHIEEDDLDAYPSDMPNVRDLFLPDPGYTLAEFDLSKADLRVVVWESEEEELKAMLKAGRNIYKEVGTDVTGMPYRKAKMFIHGTDYGGSARTMARNCGITVHQSEIAQRRWFEKYPGIHRWHRRVEQLLLTQNIATNKFGFRIMYFDRPEGVLPEALAWTPQSTVAIVINKMVRRLFDNYEAVQNHDVQLLMQVHDSVVTQIKTEALHHYVPVIFDMFSQIVVPYDDPLIIPADCKASNVAWSRMEKYDVNASLTTI